jgi:hypothetical protein
MFGVYLKLHVLGVMNIPALPYFVQPFFRKGFRWDFINLSFVSSPAVKLRI